MIGRDSRSVLTALEELRIGSAEFAKEIRSELRWQAVRVVRKLARRLDEVRVIVILDANRREVARGFAAFGWGWQIVAPGYDMKTEKPENPRFPLINKGDAL